MSTPRPPFAPRDLDFILSLLVMDYGPDAKELPNEMQEKQLIEDCVETAKTLFSQEQGKFARLDMTIFEDQNSELYEVYQEYRYTSKPKETSFDFISKGQLIPQWWMDESKRYAIAERNFLNIAEKELRDWIGLTIKGLKDKRMGIDKTSLRDLKGHTGLIKGMGQTNKIIE